MDPSEGAPPAGGLKATLARLAESIVGLLRTRAELAGVELIEERDRLVLRMALLLAGVVMLAFAALFCSVFIIALFWDSYPLEAIVAVAILYALAGALLIAKSRALVRNAPAPFSATLAELERDRVRLQRAAQDATPHEP